MTVFLVQSVLGAVATALFYLCGARLLGAARALFAGALFAVFPHFLLFTKQILTEPLYLSLLVFLLAALIIPSHLHFPTQAFLVGILLGLIGLVRREALLPAVAIVAAITWFRVPQGSALKHVWLVILFCATVTLAPWIVRNWIVLGTPTLSSTSGLNFMVGNNPLARGAYTPPPPEWSAQLRGLDEITHDRKAWELSLRWIWSHPRDFLGLLILKLGSLLSPANNPVLDGADLVLMPLYLIGIVKLIRRQRGWQMIGAIALPLIICSILIALVFVGGWRYRLSIYPAVLLLAAYGLPNALIERIPLRPHLHFSDSTP